MKVSKTVDGVTKSIEISNEKAFLLGSLLQDLDFMDATGSDYAFIPITLEGLLSAPERAEIELNKMLDAEFNIKN